MDEISLTSDTMKYDLEAGRFYADGNVTIKGRDITIIATHATGHMSSKVFNLSGNVTVNGTWNGDNVKLSMMSATAEFSAQPVYTLESGVSGSLGKINIDCDYLQMVGDNITAKNVHKLQDQKTGVVFSAENIKGKIDKGELVESEANGNIVIKGAPGKRGGNVEIRGRKALYSLGRGTVVVSGGVSATQNKRTLNTDNLVYIPATNRIEAIKDSNRPRITVNIDDEKAPSSPPN
jgi:lipopolysaccharide assembly outer membrane protein LptD (OstA)